MFLAGLALAIVMIIFNRYLAKKIGQYNEAMMEKKDSRVKVTLASLLACWMNDVELIFLIQLMTEVLLGIRVIKFNAWEKFMAEKLDRYLDVHR